MAGGAESAWLQPAPGFLERLLERVVVEEEVEEEEVVVVEEVLGVKTGSQSRTVAFGEDATAARNFSSNSTHPYPDRDPDADAEPDADGGGGAAAALDLSRAVPLALVLGAFIVFAIVGNILVILAVVCNRHLRTPTNYFIINLAIADLLLATMVLPVSATLEVLGDHWLFGRVFCDIWAALDVLCCTASIMSLCVISIDRYVGVSHPLRYPGIVTERRALLAMLGVWLLSVVISIGPLFGWKQAQPPDDTVCPITEEPFYALFSSLGSFYIPLVVILAMYCRVYVVAKRTTKNLEAGVMRERMTSGELTLRIHKGSQSQSQTQTHDEQGKGRANQARSSLTRAYPPMLVL
ncbi:hypothetical protein CRUP_008817 [Coryphaenoides rupestris]|nr:hypothetical protein CRUP_008817 [Coryphaenoides rupestris]